MKLSGWENSNRIQFSVPKDRVGIATDVVPILFRLSSTTGYSKTDLTFVFDYMSVAGSSYANRKKVAFSQLVNGEEVKLYAELDMWDHVTEKALFWVKPIELSCEYENIFYFYYDKNKDNNTDISEAGDLSIYPLINTGADANYDIHGGKPMALIKKDDKYLFWYILNTPAGGYWHSVIYYCESVDLYTFTNFTVCLDDFFVATRIYKRPGMVIYQDGMFKMWYSGNNSNSSFWDAIYYCTSSDGKVWENFTACTGLYLFTLYGTGSAQKVPSVIYEDGLYKLWFTGVGHPNTYYTSVFYAESSDGINWVNLQRLFGEDILPEVATSTELARVVNINNVYHLYISGTLSGGAGTTLFYASSIDGKTFANFEVFSPFGLEGTHDLTNISGMVVFTEIPDIYTFFYTGKLSNFNCILRFSSFFLNHPMVPSQFIWEDSFTSVHHFNPSFGYVNSANINAPVSSVSNISSTSDNLGSYAIEFNSINSYVNLGNHAIYNYGAIAQVLLFGAIDSGNIIYSKGLYSECTSTLYYQQTPLLTRASFDDTFSGTVGSIPDPYLWAVRYGAPTQNVGSLEFTQALDERVRTTFYVGGVTTEVSLNFTIDGGLLTSGWRLGFRAGFVGTNSDYLFVVVRPSTATSVYLQGVDRDTYTSRYGYSPTTPPVDYFTGKLRMVIGTNITFSYFYQDSWVILRSLGLGNVVNAPYAFIEINKTQLTSSDDTKFYISNFTSAFNNSFFSRNATVNNSLVLEYRKDNITKFLNIPDFTLNSAWSTYTFGVAAELSMLNTSVGESNTGFHYCTSSGTQVTTLPVILGNDTDGITGKISEAFFFKTQPSTDTLYLFDANLKDDLINISRYFLRGYTTKYNQTFSTNVLLYDQDTGDLLANTVSSSIDGFYYAEVPFKNNYFIVGLGDTLYNNFILSDITPQVIF